MSYYSATKKGIEDWIRKLASQNRVYFPEKHGKANYRFTQANSDSEIQFENYTPTVVPPVKLLVPAREELLRFKKNTDGRNEVSASLDTSFRILAGVRPCDLKGIYLMDLFFKDGVSDPYYLARRENTAIIGYSCSVPCDSRAFCAAVDSVRHTEGADIMITPVAGEDLLVEINTELGEKLAAEADWVPSNDGPGKKQDAFAAIPQPFGRTFPIKVPEITRIVADTWRSPVWENHVARCFSCGTCNLVCPTCYCFDVADDLNLDVSSATGRRRRR